MKPDLDLQQLRMFWTLAQTRSFTRTATQLYRTQSAVSHAIRKLEASVGAALVIRGGRVIRLTEEGECLFKACEDAFGAIDGASEAIAQRRGESIGRIRLGVTVEFGNSILMKHMRAFMEAHREIEMSFQMSHHLITPLLNDQLDMIIDCKVHSHSSLQKTTLFREKYVIVCSSEYRDLLHVSAVEDLENCTILSLDAELNWWHHFIFSIPEIRRPSFHRVIPINHIRGIITATKAGIGVAFVPLYCVLTEIGSGELIVLFPEIELLEDRFVIYQKERKSRLLRHQHLTQYLTQINPSEFGA